MDHRFTFLLLKCELLKNLCMAAWHGHEHGRAWWWAHEHGAWWAWWAWADEAAWLDGMNEHG